MTDELDDDAAYQAPCRQSFQIAHDGFRAGAIEGLIARRLKIEKTYPDSELGMQLRREAAVAIKGI